MHFRNSQRSLWTLALLHRDWLLLIDAFQKTLFGLSQLGEEWNSYQSEGREKNQSGGQLIRELNIYANKACGVNQSEKEHIS